MQKKLIALALASLAGSAFAQSNVTIYGVADAAFEFASASGATAGNASDVENRSRLSTNSSYIGFKGTEDLGNGLKAIWQVENTVNLDVGGWGSARDTYIGLTGGFGTVVAGNLTHPMRAIGANVDFNQGNTSAGATAAITGRLAGVATGTDDRAKNAVAYISPSFSGLTLAAAFVAGEDAKNSDQNKAGSYNSMQWQLAAQYNNGPLFVGAAYHYANNPRVLSAVSSTALGADVTASEALVYGGAATYENFGALAGAAAGDVTAFSYKDKLKAARIAGKYTFATDTTVAAMWDQQKYEYDIAATIAGASFSGNDFAKRTAWMLGVNQKFANKHNVFLQFAKANKTKVDGGELENSSAHQYTLGYTYDLSKRTMLRAYYSEIRNQSGVKYDFYNNPISAATGADPKVVGFGLRHSF